MLTDGNLATEQIPSWKKLENPDITVVKDEIVEL